ncbi:hypothetical protein PC39_15534 [Salinisphaera sp. PC39]|uniref:WD40/YVTN/BNR-like repeat-containing protein n=1 Tax=Salinisphaera sp. PC39 TaxID=1304156 RepID=UPI00334101AB
MRSLITSSLTLVCLTAAVAASAAAPRNVEVVTSGTPHRPLYSIAFEQDGEHGLAVGDRGTMLVTADGGASWERGQLDTELAAFDAALSGDKRVVVGQMGLIRYSDDGGASWTAVDAGTSQRLMGVSMNASGLAVAVGSFGTILLSEDGGASWRESAFNPATLVKDNYEPHLNDVHVSADGTVTIVGEFGMVLRSPDGGANWEGVHSGDVSLFGLDLHANGLGYAVGQSGTVLRTTDGGATWTSLETDLEANLLGVYADGDGTVTVPGMRRMIVSDDGGESWTQVTDGDVDRNWYIGAAATGEGLFVAGHTGRVLRVEKRPSGG